MNNRFRTAINRLVLALAILVLPAFAQTAQRGDTSASQSRTKATAASSTASDSDIADAQKSGKVWVNTSSGVYHKSGRYYGKTKQGKFMTEDEAKKAGYREAKNEGSHKKS